MTSRARSIADAYFDAVNARNIERVVNMFADGGRVMNQAGIFQGHDEIRSWYDTALASDFVMRPTQFHDAVTSCIVEFEVVGPDSSRRFLDVIEIDGDGAITRLQYYSNLTPT